MTTNPRRPWLQIHLSTAVVLMLLIALLLGILIRRDCFGEWPFIERPMSRNTWFLNAFIQSMLSGVGLFSITIGCEYLIRRREARTP
jgi:hypothetical protein